MLSDRCLSFCLSVLSCLNSWMVQDKTWHAGRSRPWPHCVRWGPSSPSHKGAHPQFSAYICCGQMAGWIKMPLGREVSLDPSDIVLDGDPSALPKKEAEPLMFGLCLLWQTAGWIKMPLGTKVDLGPGHNVLDGDPVGTQPPQQPRPTFGPCLLWPDGRPSQQLLSCCFLIAR